MPPLTLAIIEDEEAHFRLMKRAILRDIPGTIIHHFPDAAACLENLDQTAPDIVLTDYLMPGMNGIAFLETLKERRIDIPVIMITGQGDENIAVRAMKLGAWDYLVKSADFFSMLPSVIEKVARGWRFKESLRESERRFQDLAEWTSEWIWEIDGEGRVRYSNRIAQEIIGHRAGEVVGKTFYDFFPEDERARLKEQYLGIMAARESFSDREVRLAHRDGHEVQVECSAFPFFSAAGAFLGYRGIHRDITARKEAE
ncbi:MAG: PAS domain S-box protein, partial [Deltaproteobacteria bacterium]|nr:PAS domain S-box protein [Deltaproteobacteria bacterium]